VFNLVLNDLLGAIVVQADPYNVLIRTVIELRNLLTYEKMISLSVSLGQLDISYLTG